MHWYESANGDPVVISHADYLPGGTTITSVSPASTMSEYATAYKMNGLVKNPADPHQTGYSVQDGQGFDEALGYGWGPKNWDYKSALNIDPGNTGQPVGINTGDAFSLVKAVRADTATDSSINMIGKYVVLTVMPSLPPRAGKWFRPGASGAVKEWPRKPVDEMDFTSEASPLRHLARPSRLKTCVTCLSEIDSMDTHTLPMWSCTNEEGRRAQVYSELSPSKDYASDLAKYVRNYHALALHVDPGANQAEIDARKQLAILAIQWGIDRDAAHQAGVIGRSGAGQSYGYLMFYYIAGFMLGDAAMIGRAQRHIENTIAQSVWIKQEHIGYPVDFDFGSGGSSASHLYQTYQIEHLHVPEWSLVGWQDIDIDGFDLFGPQHLQNASWYALYRDKNWTNQIGCLMPILLLRNGPTPALARRRSCRAAWLPGEQPRLSARRLHCLYGSVSAFLPDQPERPARPPLIRDQYLRRMA